jgi:hypothetical protein
VKVADTFTLEDKFIADDLWGIISNAKFNEAFPRYH